MFVAIRAALVIPADGNDSKTNVVFFVSSKRAMVVGIHCSISSVRSPTIIISSRNGPYNLLTVRKYGVISPTKIRYFLFKFFQEIHIPSFLFAIPHILVHNTVSKFYSESVTLHVIRHSSLLVLCKFRFSNFRTWREGV